MKGEKRLFQEVVRVCKPKDFTSLRNGDAAEKVGGGESFAAPVGNTRMPPRPLDASFAYHLASLSNDRVWCATGFRANLADEL